MPIDYCIHRERQGDKDHAVCAKGIAFNECGPLEKSVWSEVWRECKCGCRSEPVGQWQYRVA